jgi:hypothetical protein
MRATAIVSKIVWTALAQEYDWQQQRERRSHHDDERLRMGNDGAVELRCESVERRARGSQSSRDQRIRVSAPVLVVET